MADTHEDPVAAAMREVEVRMAAEDTDPSGGSDGDSDGGGGGSGSDDSGVDVPASDYTPSESSVSSSDGGDESSNSGGSSVSGDGGDADDAASASADDSADDAPASPIAGGDDTGGAAAAAAVAAAATEEEAEAAPPKRARRSVRRGGHEDIAELQRDALSFTSKKRTTTQLRRAAERALMLAVHTGAEQTARLMAGRRLYPGNAALCDAERHALDWVAAASDHLDLHDEINKVALDEMAKEEYRALAAAAMTEKEYGSGAGDDQTIAALDELFVLQPWTTSYNLDDYIELEHGKAADDDYDDGSGGGGGGGGGAVRPQRAAKRRAIEGVARDVEADKRAATERARAEASASAKPSALRASTETIVRINIVAHMLGIGMPQVWTLMEAAVAAGAEDREASKTTELMADCRTTQTSTQRTAQAFDVVGAKCRRALGIATANSPRMARFLEALFERDAQYRITTNIGGGGADECAFTGTQLFNAGAAVLMRKATITRGDGGGGAAAAAAAASDDLTEEVAPLVASLASSLHVVTHVQQCVVREFQRWRSSGDTEQRSAATFRRLAETEVAEDGEYTEQDVKLMLLDAARECAASFTNSTTGTACANMLFVSLTYLSAFLTAVGMRESKLYNAMRDHAASAACPQAAQ